MGEAEKALLGRLQKTKGEVRAALADDFDIPQASSPVIFLLYICVCVCVCLCLRVLCVLPPPLLSPNSHSKTDHTSKPPGRGSQNSKQPAGLTLQHRPRSICEQALARLQDLVRATNGYLQQQGAANTVTLVVRCVLSYFFGWLVGLVVWLVGLFMHIFMYVYLTPTS